MALHNHANASTKLKIDVSKGPEEAAKPCCQERENLEREPGNPLVSCFPKAFDEMRARNSKMFTWPLPNRRKKHIFRKFAKFTQQGSLDFFRFPKCLSFWGVSDFFRVFALKGPSSLRIFCGFPKLQSHSSCCNILEGMKIAEILAWQTLALNE